MRLEPPKRGPWSDEEIALLKKLYAEEPALDVAVQLGRSIWSVRSKVRALGLHKTKGPLRQRRSE